MNEGNRQPYKAPTLTLLSWSCANCVRRVMNGFEYVVEACPKCIPLHERTALTHPNPLERVTSWDEGSR